ncbi:hypothetical protein HZA45_02920 [Candidatus Peregrinibacteria bacterium]|nr:hypothetical protein [Candidatus Peregrinibacteria bacterium]
MKNHVYSLSLVAIASFIALPLSLLMQLGAFQSAHLTGSVTGTSAVKNVRETARNYRATMIQETIRYQQVREKCSDRFRVDPTFVCPDFNDRSAIRAFLLSPETVAATHAAATEDEEVTLAYDGLADDDKSRMTRYLNAGTCPDSLKQYTAGFYDLCKKMLTTTMTRGERRHIPQMMEIQRKVKMTVEQRRLERLAKQKGK